MAAATHATAVGVFDEQGLAQQAVQELKTAGFGDDQIGIAVRGESTAVAGQDTENSYAGEGAAAGAAVGAGVGGLWAVGIAAGVLPVIGPAIAGGILASILTSAAVGAGAGALAGALIGLGLPEEEAAYYEEEFKAGKTVISVRADKRYHEAIEILQHNGAYDYAARGDRTRV
jgi:hypothetical protein